MAHKVTEQRVFNNFKRRLLRARKAGIVPKNENEPFLPVEEMNRRYDIYLARQEEYKQRAKEQVK